MRFAVARVLRMGANAEIAATVIELVAVDVVNLHSIRRVDNLAMHENSWIATNGTAIGAIPKSLYQLLVIAVVNDCVLRGMSFAVS